MITIGQFTKREPIHIKGKGDGTFEYRKIRIVKDGGEMTTMSLVDAVELRDALIEMFPPQGMNLPHELIRLGEPYAT